MTDNKIVKDVGKKKIMV